MQRPLNEQSRRLKDEEDVEQRRRGGIEASYLGLSTRKRGSVDRHITENRLSSAVNPDGARLSARCMHQQTTGGRGARPDRRTSIWQEKVLQSRDDVYSASESGRPMGRHARERTRARRMFLTNFDAIRGATIHGGCPASMGRREQRRDPPSGSASIFTTAEARSADRR